ncbi:lipoprotein-releasing system ATP-binding protein LolD, partial [bacterium]
MDGKYLVECNNLWKWYPSPDGRLDVLKELDFTVSAGDFYAIVGASGVGKSTLLHIFGLIDTLSRGKLYFDGKDVSQLTSTASAHLRSNSIGFVFQFHHLLPEFTAFENLL